MASETQTHVPVYGPLIEDDDIRAVEDALRLGWLGMGTNVADFEAAVLQTIGATDQRAIAVSTGHAALHVAMIVAGVGPGDEVIVPSLCHLSDVQAILATGAAPVFCDIDDETITLDPARVAELVTPATKAILTLDYGCYLSDYESLRQIADASALRIVHDAAHSFGASSQGRPVGSYSDLCMFSFDPVKSLTAIDAGVLVVNNDVDERIAREVRLLGSDQPAAVMYKNARTWDYDAVRIGYRYHLSNIHAALATSQVPKIGRVRRSRVAATERYAENLKGYDAIRAPQGTFGELCPFHYFVRVDADHRDPVRAYLAEQGIDTGVHWRPAHLHTYFQQFRRGPLPFTEAAGQELITLPLHSAMSLDLVDRVCDTLLQYFR
jgi:dTDP-4-amino-4,6-dideoxygalactose transaminase